MKTAGQILREIREKKQIGLDQVAQETKIRKQYLIALEKDDYQFFPSATTIKGFIRNYAQFLGIDPKEISPIFKRDYRRTKEQKLILQPGDKFNNQLQWDQKKSLFLIVSLFILAFLIYLGYQYHSLLGRPGLEIFSPLENQQTNEEQITVKGKTNPDNSITINGNLIQLNLQGEFNYRLRLIAGENKIVIEATNRLGIKTKQTRTVYYTK